MQKDQGVFDFGGGFYWWMFSNILDCLNFQYFENAKEKTLMYLFSLGNNNIVFIIRKFNVKFYFYKVE